MRIAFCIPDECLSIRGADPHIDVSASKEIDRPYRMDCAETVRQKVGFGIRRRKAWRGSRIQRSGARRTGQPRPGAPGSRPRIGSAADLLLLFTTSALSGSLHFFLRRAAPLSAQTSRSETFAVATNALYRPFGNSLSECLRCMRRDSAILAFASAFLFNGTGSNRRFGHVPA